MPCDFDSTQSSFRIWRKSKWWRLASQVTSVSLQTSYRLIHVVSLVSKAPIRLAVKSPDDGDNISLRTIFGGDLSRPETPGRLTYNLTKGGTGLAPVEWNERSFKYDVMLLKSALTNTRKKNQACYATMHMQSRKISHLIIIIIMIVIKQTAIKIFIIIHLPVPSPTPTPTPIVSKFSQIWNSIFLDFFPQIAPK